MDNRSTWRPLFRHERKIWKQISAPQTLLSYWLKLAQKRFAAEFHPNLEEFDLIPSEWSAIREIYRPGGLSPLGIAEAIGMTKGGASKLVNRLVKRGLVTKTVEDHDVRMRRVTLTTAGKRLLRRLELCEFLADNHVRSRLQGAHELIKTLRFLVGLHREGYQELWIAPDGKSGQWQLQADWHRTARRAVSANATVGGSQQRFQFFGSQFTKAATR